jgi:hypothetical protein
MKQDMTYSHSDNMMHFVHTANIIQQRVGLRYPRGRANIFSDMNEKLT